MSSQSGKPQSGKPQSGKPTIADMSKAITDTMDTIRRQAEAAQDKLHQEYLGYQSALPIGADGDLLRAKYQYQYITIEQKYNSMAMTALDEYKKGLELLINHKEQQCLNQTN